MVTSESTTKRKPNGAQVNRGDKAQRLVYGGHVHPQGTGRTYKVDSESGSGQYLVSVAGERYHCTCQDFRRYFDRTKIPHPYCKHAQSVALYRRIVRESWRPHLEVA